MKLQGGTGGNVCAIFGDIVDSRNAQDRAELQKRVLSVIKDINARFASEIIAPFRIVSGDEVAGLLRGEARSYEIISNILNAIRPHRIRFAVGVGGVTTGISDDVNLIDGPALHRARSAMAVLKNRKGSQGRVILYSSANDSRDNILNALSFLLTSLKSNWTQEQRLRVDMIKSGLTLREIGSRLGVSHQAIARSIIDADYYAVVEGESALAALLEQQ